MRIVRFRSSALPEEVGGEVRRLLRHEHARRPFSATDPRDTVRRVGQVMGALGMPATVYRGAVDLRGAEVDHVWVELHGRVVDVAFPLLEVQFVSLLRAFAAGDLPAEELARAAEGIHLDARVLGEFPEPIRYLGEPVWRGRVLPPPP